MLKLQNIHRLVMVGAVGMAVAVSAVAMAAHRRLPGVCAISPGATATCSCCASAEAKPTSPAQPETRTAPPRLRPPRLRIEKPTPAPP